MTSGRPRYDGHAEWYDQRFSASSLDDEELAFLRESLSAGSAGSGGDDPPVPPRASGSWGDVCIDVACGTGRYGRVLADAGYRTVGFDLSADQLRFARGRLDAAVRAEGRLLPVRDASVAMAAGMFFHTDVEDFEAIVRDVARCLRPAGRFVYLGVHPCFVGPFVTRLTEREDLRLNVVAGYGAVEWANRGSGDGSVIGGRVGFHHKTLASFLGAFATAGLTIRAVREFHGSRGVIVPWDIGLVTEKS